MLHLCLFLSHGKCFPTAAENSVLQVVLNSLKVNNKFIQPRTNNSCRKTYLQSAVLSILCPYNKCYHDSGGCKEYIFEAMYDHLAVQNPLMPMGVMLLNHLFWVKYRWLSNMLYFLMQAEELLYWESHSKNVWICTTPLSLQIRSVISSFWNRQQALWEKENRGMFSFAMQAQQVKHILFFYRLYAFSVNFTEILSDKYIGHH